ncbi:MAG: two-component system, NarL family, nitrate/nitrite response regulator NarL [Frankiales bacterium]|jgi:CheY-like chemotaxis protein|nr:two-component system, NarL family, nitrate/nitrite response regulator NarL [Frankiales bacterium]
MPSVPLSILVVDDSPELADILSFMIDLDERYELVGTATTGPEAIAMAERLEPAAIVLDQMMPESTGAQALPSLRAHCPDSTIVLFTAVGTERLALDTKDMADACMSKGVSLPELLDVIAELHHAREVARLTDI